MSHQLSLAPENALTWVAAASAGFALVQDWQAWADLRIEHLAKVPYWLYDLSLAKDSWDLWAVAKQAMYEIDLQKAGALNFSHEVLGFYFIRYKLGQITLPELLEKAGIVADGGFAGGGPEVYYDILNRIEAGQVTLEVAASEAAEELAPEAAIAAAQWNAMMPDRRVSLA